jgi:predicted Rossmann fold flavoprotein
MSQLNRMLYRDVSRYVGGMDADVVVVGAGAAGLWAAERVARAGAQVLVLEKTPRAGTKILASGGTRCNLTTTLGPVFAARLFGEAETFLLPALKALPPAEVRARFRALGVPTVIEPELEKVFPESQRAVDVRDALLAAAERAGARLRYRSPVRGLRPVAEGWEVQLDEGLILCRKLMLCPGGRSYPKTGTTGDGYAWLSSLGLTVIPPVPALVPLTSDADWVTELSGIALPHAEARLQDASRKVVARRRRPVLFTHKGLSGPGAMDLSEPVARGGQGWHMALDLMPDRDLDGLRTELQQAAGRPGGPHLARVLGPVLPTRILSAVCRQAGLPDNPALHQVPRKARNLLVDALKGLLVPLSGTLGWDMAEVTGGGLARTEVDPLTLQVLRWPSLYVFGELLDVQGPIGGLNFQAAFSTAELAARHAAATSRC